MSGRELQARVAALLYGLFLFAYPRHFRRRYRTELERIFDDQIAATRSGRRGLPGLTASSCLDALRNGLAERFASGRMRPRDRHEVTRGLVMETFYRDVRLAIRGILRAPAFTIIAVLTIALGIGANTAIFSVVNAVLLRQLPYEEPDRLVLLWGEMTRRGVRHFPSSPPDLADMRRMSSQVESIAAVLTFPQALTSDDGRAERIMTAGVTTNFLDVLGLETTIGRGFGDEDGRPDPNADAGTEPAQMTAVILDHAFWRERFGGDSAIVGRIINLSGTPSEVVGVLQPGVQLHMPAPAAVSRDIDAWIALRLDYDNAPRNNVFLRPIGRLAPGATTATAQQEMDRIAAELNARFPIKAGSGFRISVVSMHEDLVRAVRPIVVALMGTVGFVLLVACANVANLLLVRAVGREREMAVRASMGGSPGRLVSQLLVESLVLGVLGAAAGVMLAAVGVRAVLALAPADLPRLDAVSIDGTVLAYTAIATLLAVAAFGIVPAMRASRPQLMDILREGGRNPGLGAGRVLRNLVVVAEVALSLVLLVGAGLLVRSFDSLRRVDPGWSAERLLAFDVSLPFARFPEARQQTELNLQLLERLRGLPGVSSVSAAFPLPFERTLFHGRWGTDEALTDPDAFRQAAYVVTMPDYFETIDTELVAGRLFTDADASDSSAVVVVDEQIAQLAFGGEPAVGRDVHVRITAPEPQRVRIIGVVKNQRRESLIEEERGAIYFAPLFAGGMGQMGWILRSQSGDPGTLIDAVRAEVRTLHPEIPVANVRMLEEDVNRAMAPTRFELVLIGAFAGIALLLAMVGLYGVLSFAVRQRTAEIGVRVAFGAPRGHIVRLVVRQGVMLGAAGIVVGLFASLGLTRLIASLLVDVTPTDPPTFAAVALLFLIVAALASWVPARRAAGLDPVLALREE